MATRKDMKEVVDKLKKLLDDKDGEGTMAYAQFLDDRMAELTKLYYGEEISKRAGNTVDITNRHGTRWTLWFEQQGLDTDLSIRCRDNEILVVPRGGNEIRLKPGRPI